ncbi:hypothetical protein COCON_G00145370 [Conger conger]|uniref:MHC class I-like antigen recognition-like domain-containing protein n=1 Tax=Conger conger TaxID=82655 RepID=A0A9Q1DBN7_CONCO|nr:hypothetical protein COCON_G00145370 [Conger conger]
MKGITALLFLLQATAANTGSHSLWAFATFMHRRTQFPEFSVVVMLDDLQVLYYERNMKILIFRSQPSSKHVVEDIVEGAKIAMEDIYNSMSNPLHRVNLLSNHTGGVHVHQMLAGCVLDNDKASPVMMWEAYDGAEAAHYDMHNHTVSPLWPQLMWTTLKEAAIRMEYINVYQPICIRTLKYYLEKEKNIVFRKGEVTFHKCLTKAHVLHTLSLYCTVWNNGRHTVGCKNLGHSANSEARLPFIFIFYCSYMMKKGPVQKLGKHFGLFTIV